MKLFSSSIVTSIFKESCIAMLMISAEVALPCLRKMSDVIKKKIRIRQEESSCFNYLGLQVSQTQNGIEVHKQNYTDTIKSIKIAKGRVTSDMFDEEENHQV